MMWMRLLLVACLLAACSPSLPDPCDQGSADGGIGGTGQCTAPTEE